MPGRALRRIAVPEIFYHLLAIGIILMPGRALRRIVQDNDPDKRNKLTGEVTNAGQKIARDTLTKAPRARIISPVSLSGRPVKDVNDLPAKDLEAWLASENVFPQPRALL